MNRSKSLRILFSLATLVLAVGGMLPSVDQAVAGPEVVTLDSASPLVRVRLMVRVGSADDPAGMEGLANITANAILQGAFGNADDPITKERLAEITRSWGEGASPSVRVAKEATTFYMTIPAAVMDEYVSKVLAPMLSTPLFLESEVDRLVNESTTRLTGFLRYESIEMLGLTAMDNYLFDGTTYGHAVTGSVEGLGNIGVNQVKGFFKKHYRPDNLILGVSTNNADIRTQLESAVAGLGKVQGGATLPKVVRSAPAPVNGRELTVVAMPNSGATGVHLAYPIAINRTHPDYWPLYVANVFFGTHRDGHGVLYQRIREERGYNYGDYSYVEHFAGRPYSLFPPFNTPRKHQYFSMWIRPVANEHAHHLLKAAVYELENLIRTGVSEADVANSKNKARVLYLNLAETSSRLLGAKLDDAFYGLEDGYLESYLEKIEAVTTEQVNAAIAKYLQYENLKILVVTEAELAEQFATDVRNNTNTWGKQPADYQIASESEEGGETFLNVPEARLETLRRDAVWANTWLDIPSQRVRVVSVEQIFQSGAFITELDDSAR